MTVVYKITCLLDGRAYIGVTDQEPRKRFKGHLSVARGGWGTPLHAAIRQYGAKHFAMAILTQTETRGEALRLEQRLITELGTQHPTGFNWLRSAGRVPRRIRLKPAAVRLGHSAALHKGIEAALHKISVDRMRIAQVCPAFMLNKLGPEGRL